MPVSAKAMPPAPTLGEIVHPNADFLRILRKYVILGHLPDVEEVARYYIERLPGAATIGSGVETENVRKQFQRENSRILAANPDTPGLDLGISYQTGGHYDSLAEIVVAHSPVLTLNDWKAIQSVNVTGGADAYFIFLPTFTSKGECKETHWILAVFPQIGAPFFTESIWNPRFVEVADQSKVEEIYGPAHYKHPKIREARTPAELLFTPQIPLPNLGYPDMISFGRIEPRGLMFPDVVETTRPFVRSNPDERLWPAQGVIQIKLNQSEYRHAASIYRLLQESHKRGAIASNGIHTNSTSCLMTITRMIYPDATLSDLKITPNHHIDEVMDALLTHRSYRCYWNDTKTGTFYDFYQKNQKGFKPVTPTMFRSSVKNLLQHRPMWMPYKGNAPFNTTYCRTGVPHPNSAAKLVYSDALDIALRLLKKMKI